MVVVRRGTMKSFYQERLSADDIRLLAQLIDIARRNELPTGTTETRVELLIGKLHRMEKQK